MYATVKTIEDILNELAPVETAESYDNVGLPLAYDRSVHLLAEADLGAYAAPALGHTVYL